MAQALEVGVGAHCRNSVCAGGTIRTQGAVTAIRSDDGEGNRTQLMIFRGMDALICHANAETSPQMLCRFCGGSGDGMDGITRKLCFRRFSHQFLMEQCLRPANGSCKMSRMISVITRPCSVFICVEMRWNCLSTASSDRLLVSIAF
jgi:hypothetical protein